MIRRVHSLGLALLLTLALSQAHAGADRFVQRQRRCLDQARSTLASSVSSPNADTTVALRRYTSTIDRVVRAVDNRVRRELGPPPRDPATGKPMAYELFAMGSYARRELAPYSDLDYGVLTARSGRRVSSYFQRYGLRFKGLLTTIEGQARIKPCDGMSPSGTYAYALVGTAPAMAARAVGLGRELRGRPRREQEYIQSALGSTRKVLAHGGAGLHRSYRQEVRTALGNPAIRSGAVQRLLPSLRDPFGLPAGAADPTWSAGLATPPLKNPDVAIKTGQVNIKHDILRVFQMPINIFRQTHGIEATGTTTVLRQMVRRGHLDAELGHQLQQVFNTAVGMRVRRHLERGATDDKLGPLSAGQRSQLRGMLQPLRGLRRAAAADGP